jgi:hypothetical protein
LYFYYFADFIVKPGRGMKKINSLSFCLIFCLSAMSQMTDSTIQTIEKKDWSKIDLSNRANDHFLIQYGSDNWLNTPDSINTSGFSRHFNAYVMIDKVFKNNPRMSVGFGAGLGSSNIFFSNTYVDIKSNNASLPFTNVSLTNRFDKFKLTTIYLEVPVELRWAQHPENTNTGFKAAIGLKGGTLLKAFTKGKDLQDTNGNSVYDSRYIVKESSKRFINGNRISVTGRVGYGNISVHGSYALTGVLRTATGPTLNNLSIGLTLSGL